MSLNTLSIVPYGHTRRGRPGSALPLLRRVSGVALVSVLLVVALASAFASQMVSRQVLTVAHARQVFHGAQAREYAFGAEAFARQLLFEDWSTDATRDTLLEAWSLPGEPFEIEGGLIELTIVDLERRLNLNAVNQPENLQRLKLLMANLELDPNLADAWRDWIDRDETVHGFGAEDGDYLMAVPPYRAANQAAASTTSMLAVKGFSRAVHEQLAPHVAALPVDALKVNINTVGAEVLRTLGNSLTAEAIEVMMESPREFQAVAEAKTQYPGLSASEEVLTVTSTFFEVSIRVELDGARAELISMLHRNPASGEIRLLRRNFGRRVPSIYEVGPVDDEDTPNG